MGLQVGTRCWLYPQSSCYRLLRSSGERQLSRNRRWRLVTSSWVWNLSGYHFFILSDLKVIRRGAGCVCQRTVKQSIVLVSIQGTLTPLSYQLQAFILRKKAVMERRPVWRDNPYLGGLDKRSASSKPAWETQQVLVPKRGNETKLMKNGNLTTRVHVRPAMGQLVTEYKLREL